MVTNTYLIITSISKPNAILQEISNGAMRHGWNFVVVGDKKSPPQFELEGCEFLPHNHVSNDLFSYAAASPFNHYSRKNIGYLWAIKNGAEIIVETDDDNIPKPNFWGLRRRFQAARLVSKDRWINAYQYFTDKKIWPRGLPLDAINESEVDLDPPTVNGLDCPVQQGLADKDPDVDAIYRLVLGSDVWFDDNPAVALGRSSYCPFNSQNTTWFRDAFPLLYLPATCSQRMCDIWRGLVAQRILHATDWHLLFHKPTVTQERNDHILMRDFQEELHGYLSNRQLVEELEQLSLPYGSSYLHENLLRCYEKLVELKLVSAAELDLVNCWLEDLSNLSAQHSNEQYHRSAA